MNLKLYVSRSEENIGAGDEGIGTPISSPNSDPHKFNADIGMGFLINGDPDLYPNLFHADLNNLIIKINVQPPH
jgi:hypothetical protein